MKKFILAVLALIFALSGCARQAVTETPDISAAPTIAPLISATTPARTAEPSSPPAEESEGYPREYEYNGQKVIDYLGDGDFADSAREYFLKMHEGSNMTEDYYHIFLGIPKEVPGGWLVSAGKRHDGEWMPHLYHLAFENGEIEIIARFANYDVWRINRAYITTPQGVMWVYFNQPIIYNQESSPRRIEIADAEGNVYFDEVPQGYHNMLVVGSGEDDPASLSVTNTLTGNAVPYELYLREDGGGYALSDKLTPEQIERNIYHNINTACDADTTFQDLRDAPHIKFDARSYGATDFSEYTGFIIEANYDDGVNKISADNPIPIVEILRERYWRQMFTLTNKYGQFTFIQGSLGEPESLKAILYTYDGKGGYTSESIPVNEGVMTVERPGEGVLQALKVTADYGGNGRITFICDMN